MWIVGEVAALTFSLLSSKLKTPLDSSVESPRCQMKICPRYLNHYFLHQGWITCCCLSRSTHIVGKWIDFPRRVLANCFLPRHCKTIPERMSACFCFPFNKLAKWVASGPARISYYPGYALLTSPSPVTSNQTLLYSYTHTHTHTHTDPIRSLGIRSRSNKRRGTSPRALPSVRTSLVFLYATRWLAAIIGIFRSKKILLD